MAKWHDAGSTVALGEKGSGKSIMGMLVEVGTVSAGIWPNPPCAGLTRPSSIVSQSVTETKPTALVHGHASA